MTPRARLSTPLLRSRKFFVNLTPERTFWSHTMSSRLSQRVAATCLTGIAVLALVSCGSDASPPLPSSGVGGETAIGGSATGNGGSFGIGGSVSGNGGSATGGAGTGGNSSVGGAAVGGSATGGAATGGATNVGGSATGGRATGGATNVGGGNATGGSATGGRAAGGATAAGGSAAGGATATGGVTATGGSTSTSTCPSIASQTCTVGESNCFSFFVASRARMFAAAQAFNGSTKGWGGDFRYGTADGLTGADKLCTEIAKQSLSTNCRTWKAFLSTSSVNAISRVGSGPWYDRLNRLIASDLTQLVATRPGGITNSTILNNLPNEDGTPHHAEEVGCTDVNTCADNHDVLTGSDTDGKVCTSTTCSGGGMIGFPGGGGTTVTDYTCQGWTLGTSIAGIAPRVGHTWPTGGGIGGGQDDWISQLTENGCAPGMNLNINSIPNPTGLGTVGDGGGYGAIYCLASQ